MVIALVMELIKTIPPDIEYFARNPAKNVQLGGPNSIFVPIKVTALVAAAQVSGSAQTLSCADTPGAQDNILTTADVQVLDALIAGMNTHIKSVAQDNGWAYLDLAAVWAQWVARRGPFSVANMFN